MSTRPFNSLSIATALSDSDCAAADCVTAATAAIDLCWEQLSQAATLSMLGAEEDDDEMPDASVLSLLEAFDAEEDEEFDTPESPDDSAPMLYRKRRQRLANRTQADWDALQLVGLTLEALFDAFAQFDEDPQTLLQVVEHIGTPALLESIVAGELHDDEEDPAEDVEEMKYLDWTQLDRLPSRGSNADEE